MLAVKRNFTSNIIELQAPPQPTVNSVIQYMRCGRLITGKLLGTHWYQVARYSAVVCEYIIVPDKGYSNLSFHVVPEEDVVWQQPKAVCPRCNGMRIIDIRGDESTDCPDCGFVDEWRVF